MHLLTFVRGYQTRMHTFYNNIPVNFNEPQTQKEGRNGFLRCCQQFRSYRDEIEIRNQEIIPFSSGIVPVFFQLQEDHR